MEWDIGLRGLATLLAMSLGFGLVAQLFAGKGVSRWMWLIASAVFFIAGLLIGAFAGRAIAAAGRTPGIE